MIKKIRKSFDSCVYKVKSSSELIVEIIFGTGYFMIGDDVQIDGQLCRVTLNRLGDNHNYNFIHVVAPRPFEPCFKEKQRVLIEHIFWG